MFDGNRSVERACSAFLTLLIALILLVVAHHVGGFLAEVLLAGAADLLLQVLRTGVEGTHRKRL